MTVRLRRPNYSEQQALWFIAACTLLGGAFGILYSLMRG